MKPTISRAIAVVTTTLGFARRREATVAVAEAELGLPGDVADRLGQALEPVEQLAADPGLHAVGPGAEVLPDERPRRPGMPHGTAIGAPTVAGGRADHSIGTRRAWALPALVMPPRRTLVPLERSEGTSPR